MKVMTTDAEKTPTMMSNIMKQEFNTTKQNNKTQLKKRYEKQQNEHCSSHKL
jgi:hypothetical protein